MKERLETFLNSTDGKIFKVAANLLHGSVDLNSIYFKIYFSLLFSTNYLTSDYNALPVDATKSLRITNNIDLSNLSQLNIKYLDEKGNQQQLTDFSGINSKLLWYMSSLKYYNDCYVTDGSVLVAIQTYLGLSEPVDWPYRTVLYTYQELYEDNAIEDYIEEEYDEFGEYWIYVSEDPIDYPKINTEIIIPPQFITVSILDAYKVKDLKEFPYKEYFRSSLNPKDIKSHKDLKQSDILSGSNIYESMSSTRNSLEDIRDVHITYISNILKHML